MHFHLHFTNDWTRWLFAILVVWVCAAFLLALWWNWILERRRRRERRIRREAFGTDCPYNWVHDGECTNPHPYVRVVPDTREFTRLLGEFDRHPRMVVNRP